MTEKELGRLKRPDLLALLVAQGRESAEQELVLDETRKALSEAEQLIRRLKERLDEKDGQIEHLKEKLDEKDDQLERLKEKLNEKDTQLERLKKRLDDKDERISTLNAQLEDLISGRYLEIDSLHAPAEIADRLELMLRLAQNATTQYMSRIRQLTGGGGGKEGTE